MNHEQLRVRSLPADADPEPLAGFAVGLLVALDDAGELATFATLRLTAASDEVEVAVDVATARAMIDLFERTVNGIDPPDAD